jgi:transcription antitermination factor NusA-like protein
MEVTKTARGPQIIVSRAHRSLLRRMFELEVPEIYSGAVEIRAVAREAGHRSKVAVAARQEGIDPVGCCVGLRGIRIQNIVNELNDEKIDVIEWVDDPTVMIANALSPAQVSSVELNEAENTALVSVPDKQLSLAIGKEGQNARLAAKLTGWRIDIKSLSVMEAERASQAKIAASEKEEVPVEPEAAVLPAEEIEAAAAGAGKETAAVQEEVSAETAGAISDMGITDEFVLEELEEEVIEEEEEEGEQITVSDLEFVLSSSLHLPEQNAATKIRFAEDILPSKMSSGRKKGRKDIDLKDKKAKKGKAKKVSYSKEDEFES